MFVCVILYIQLEKEEKGEPMNKIREARLKELMKKIPPEKLKVLLTGMKKIEDNNKYQPKEILIKANYECILCGYEYTIEKTVPYTSSVKKYELITSRQCSHCRERLLSLSKSDLIDAVLREGRFQRLNTKKKRKNLPITAWTEHK